MEENTTGVWVQPVRAWELTCDTHSWLYETYGSEEVAEYKARRHRAQYHAEETT